MKEALLKNCPFCGELKKLQIKPSVPEEHYMPMVIYRVECESCGCTGRSHFGELWCEDKQTACKAWNERNNKREESQNDS